MDSGNSLTHYRVIQRVGKEKSWPLILAKQHRKRISFENKQKLLRIVLDKVVVNDWRVDLHYNIPLPKPVPPPGPKVSTKLDLRSTCTLVCCST